MGGILYERGQVTLLIPVYKLYVIMNKELLLKYISGKASQQEKEEVATWIDAAYASSFHFVKVTMHSYGRIRKVSLGKRKRLFRCVPLHGGYGRLQPCL